MQGFQKGTTNTVSISKHLQRLDIGTVRNQIYSEDFSFFLPTLAHKGAIYDFTYCNSVCASQINITTSIKLVYEGVKYNSKKYHSTYT